MIEFEQFFAREEFKPWRATFEEALRQRTSLSRHGDLPTWLDYLQALPDTDISAFELDKDTLIIGRPEDLSPQQQAQLQQNLFNLKPWRKGPFQFFGTFIDTEWRSDWKWRRIAPHISSLKDRYVLDVGCGTGYHAWRMLGAEAKYVMGIDPSMRFHVQYLCAQKYLKHAGFDFLPLGIEDLPNDLALFDSVFSMGVLYHRRRPENHIQELKNCLREGGELILETLVVDEDFEGLEDGIFRPPERYAQMRNVWSLLSVEKCLALLVESGFKNSRCVDISITSVEEQRSTDWMQFHSLKEFLNPSDQSLTIEGHPAPKRATFIAVK